MAILGIDEVGRGPWAGPLLVCACVLHGNVPGLTDSKKLTAKKREELEPIIKQNSSYGFGWVSAAELDQLGLSQALRQATRKAVRQVKAPFHQIIIDGTINFLSDTQLVKHVTTLAKADLLVPEVSAASILAKVARDNYMKNLAKEYPNYHFEKHVGYGTALHKKSLETFGPCPEHRFSFKPVADQRSKKRKESVFRGYYEPEKYPRDGGLPFPREYPNLERPLPYFSTTKSIGDKAEQKVAEYLESEGHQILARNWRTKICEIDIISIKANTIYFTEVKYRKTSTHGDPLESITKTKQKQMQKSAAIYLKNHPKLYTVSCILAAASVTGPNFTLQNFLTLP